MIKQTKPKYATVQSMNMFSDNTSTTLRPTPNHQLSKPYIVRLWLCLWSFLLHLHPLFFVCCPYCPLLKLTQFVYSSHVTEMHLSLQTFPRFARHSPRHEVITLITRRRRRRRKPPLSPSNLGKTQHDCAGISTWTFEAGSGWRYKWRVVDNVNTLWLDWACWVAKGQGGAQCWLLSKDSPLKFLW